jgi:phosphoglycerate dehydrogenase-like enzyme
MTVLGFGGIGSTVGKVAKNGFGMRVIGADAYPSQDPAIRECASEMIGLDQLQRVIPETDFFVGVLPHTKETADYINMERVFSKLKRTSVFMSIGRGTTVVEEDLIKALKEKIIAAAVLDVTRKEPLEQESPLWTMPNVLIYPHSADLDQDRMEHAVEQFVTNLENWKEGRALVNQVNRSRGF